MELSRAGTGSAMLRLARPDDRDVLSEEKLAAPAALLREIEADATVRCPVVRRSPEARTSSFSACSVPTTGARD